ncbi:unnamed protein product [Caenorhabditis nigoni]
MMSLTEEDPLVHRAVDGVVDTDIENVASRYRNGAPGSVYWKTTGVHRTEEKGYKKTGKQTTKTSTMKPTEKNGPGMSNRDGRF